MNKNNNPEIMIIEQINILSDEEQRLQALLKNAVNKKAAIKMHLDELDIKKKKLLKLCKVMGISQPVNHNHVYMTNHNRPLKNGRFGSSLVEQR